MRKVSVAILLFLIALTASARSYDAETLPYSDVDEDDAAAIAISTLTDLGVLTGNPDGTFRPHRLLNRAEFVTIAMRLRPNPGFEIQGFQDFCFPDVAPNTWYAPHVCRAKELGIVRGNAIPGVSEDEWLFAPERPVQYEEAIKILIELFDIPLAGVGMGEWYDPYLVTVSSLGMELPRGPGYKLRRDEMAQLSARFYAYDQGDIVAYREAESGESSVSSAVSSFDELRMTQQSSRSSSSSSISSIASIASQSSFITDPDSDTDTSPNFLLLGNNSPILASVKVFSDSEPIDVTLVTVVFTSDVSALLDQLIVYDHDARLIGKASLDSTQPGGDTFTLRMKTADLQLPYREDYSFYMRGRLRHFDSGGVSGETVKINSITVEGDGSWSNRHYTKASSGTFSTHQTARSRIISIENADSDRGALVNGPAQPLGSYRFAGELGDSRADLRVTNLTFQIESIGNVTIDNVTLGADGTSERMSCSVGSSTVTCSDIDESFGSFEDHPRILDLEGDITVPSTSNNAALRLTLNQPGDISSAGVVTWTDGTTSFEWVPFSSPMARGTYWE